MYFKTEFRWSCWTNKGETPAERVREGGYYYGQDVVQDYDKYDTEW